jgi:hypothetical protein
MEAGVEAARVVVRANGCGEGNDSVERMPPQARARSGMARLGAIHRPRRRGGAHRRSPGAPLGMRSARRRRNPRSLDRERGRRVGLMRQRRARASRRGQKYQCRSENCQNRPPKRFHSLLGAPGGSPRCSDAGIHRRSAPVPRRLKTSATTQAITPLSGGTKEIRRGSERAPTHKQCPAAPWDPGRPGNGARTPERIWTSSGRALRSHRSAGGAP